MYRSIMVAVDNSEWSEHATNTAIALAKATGATLTGNHVYAAALHSRRFQQVEPGLPERYQAEEVLQRQRDIHVDLIARGLAVISDSYLDIFEQRCLQAGVRAQRKATEGRNYEQLVRDAKDSGYDLVVIGAHGLGRVKRSILGSVCERVARLVACDVLVVHDGRDFASGPLMVAIDGSAYSFAALRAAFFLGRLSHQPLYAVAAYDPFFHGVAFKSIAGVLSAERARLFRFEAQQRLHDEIIDSGLMQVYRSHLLLAKEMAHREGLSLDIQVLEGKPFDAVSAEVERVQPALLLVGRHGIHRGEGVTMGSTAENLVRVAGCNVLVVNRDVPEADTQADTQDGTEKDVEEAMTAKTEVRWSDEARARLERVPPFARPMARKSIENYARERGYTEITLPVYEEARQHFSR